MGQKKKKRKKKKIVACSAGVFWACESLFNVRVVVSAVFDFMTEEDCMGRIEIVKKYSRARRRFLICRLNK